MTEQCTASVPATDRAFLYGDGLFETLLVVGGTPLWPELHLDRLKLGGERLGIEVCIADIQTAIVEALGNCVGNAGVLRITVSRRGGRRGYAPTKNAGVNISTMYSELGREPFQVAQAATVLTSSIRMGEQPLLAGLKHCNRLEQVMAAAEAQEKNVDDVLLRLADGSYQCSSNANVFAIYGGTLLTPDCNRSGVLGTRRRLILEQLSGQLGLSAEEGTLKAAQLEAADAMFICNTVVGIREVAQWDEHSFEPSAVVRELQRTYKREAQFCCAI
ncbi:aminodeoxychorismate lyase [Congregibacter variabilis]|uniref:Aminodeoxychorismate lyase n=1 Tax=Congregibacter variabilis TaxID=3081200 RepID=A0ABZ0I5Y2_9GAMM|nr:aminodeoxychorismate lyase [Congregibacter sp. IMCC43200]